MSYQVQADRDPKATSKGGSHLAVPTSAPGVEVGVSSQFPKPERNTQFRQAVEIQDP